MPNVFKRAWGSHMWIPTKNDAVEMFARQFGARHRHGAVRRARERAEALDAKGDHEGSQIWTAVAELIDRKRQQEQFTAGTPR